MLGSTISHYRIIAKLGGGGMGVVYKAEDIRLHRIVALKFLPPELIREEDAKKRFIHEAEAASSLDHNNICAVHEIDEIDGQMFICMNYYEGETLKKKIDRGTLKTEDSVDIGIQIAQGLQQAHEKGIVHRDIKPANIFITNNNVVKILDFGLAKLSGYSVLTRVGETLGTTPYMSPEQVRGDKVDQRTDIWSLGVVLYQMITNILPFKGEYDNAVLYNILNQEPEPITDVQPELGRIILKSLNKNPDQRYNNTDELLVDLKSCQTGAVPVPHINQPSVSRFSRKRSLYAGFAVLIVLLIIIYLVLPAGEKKEARLKMIAVLPFENLGPAEDEYFADGLTEEITSRLAQVSNLGVISRTSSMQYKKTNKTLPVIAEELGVDYILEGTIRWVKTGEHGRIRITPQLIKVSGDTHLWADNIDRTLDDIFTIQTEIAKNVINSLDIVLNESEKRGIENIPTRNMEAYQAFLQSFSYSPYEREGLDKIMELCQQAIRLDSTFARCYVSLSWVHLRYYWFGFDRTEKRLSTAKRFLDKAFALQPDLPQAKYLLACYYYSGLYDLDLSLKTFLEVEKVLPNSADVLLAIAYIWRRQGKFEQALEQQKKGFELDPKNSYTLYETGYTLLWMGRFSEAIEYFDRYNSLALNEINGFLMKSFTILLWQGNIKKSRSEVERIPPENQPWLWMVQLDNYERNYKSALERLNKVTVSSFDDQWSVTSVSQVKGLVYRFMNDTVHSRAEFNSARLYLESELKKRPDDERLHSSLGIVYAGLGMQDLAVREAELSVNMMPLTKDAVRGMNRLIDMVCTLILAGKYEAAIDKLELLLSLKNAKVITANILRLDPIYDPLRNNKRFKKLIN